MKASELAMTMASMQAEIDKAISQAKTTLELNFEGLSQNNEEVEKEHNLHYKAVDYLIYSSLGSRYKKLVDQSKKDLDEAVPNPDGVAGQTVTLGNTNLFHFAKKQNNDGSSTLVTDLVTELARLGVEKSVVDKALKKATKPKRGNVYYQVTVAEG